MTQRAGKKICFVCLTAYPILSSKNLGYAGGAEVDQVLLAKELLKHGFSVTFITFDEGTARKTENIEGIEVIKAYRRVDVPKLNLLSKLRLMWNAMHQSDADFYFEEGVFGIVGLFSFLHHKKFIYCVPSDIYVAKDKLSGEKFVYKISSRLNIKLANVIVAQNEFQAKILQRDFGSPCAVIPPGYPLTNLVSEKANPPIVLWVGTVYGIKQPELFLELAKAIPEAKFQMAGGPHADPEFYNQVKESASKIPNLEFLGFVPFQEIDRYFRRASIFVNTSRLEGFPTTFVQAWSAGLPTVSLNIDPLCVIISETLPPS